MYLQRVRIHRHRINTLEDLETVPAGLGLELDLRSDGPDIICTHDPFRRGLTMDTFFAHLKDRPLVLNVKCEGIVDPVLEACARHGLEDFFFLGLSLSDTMKCVQRGERRVANYYCEHDHPEQPLSWAGKVGWLWVDCFTRYPVHDDVWDELADRFTLCIGSPELYGHPPDVQATIRAQLEGRTYHEVCTKKPELWGG